jgi:malate/lactate dehydrogenase
VNVVVYGGAGGVGSSLAFNLLARGGGHDVTIVDTRQNMVVSHAMDLEQVLEQGCSGSLCAAGEEALAQADVLVVCASTVERLTSTRMDFLEGNAAIVRHLGELLGGKGSFGGVVLMVTNPVDPLVALLARESGIDRRRLIGYTLNDSLRLRTGIARVLGLEHGRVEAWVLGEHGDASVPLFSRVRVDGEPVELSAEQREQVLAFTSTWFARHKGLEAGRSSTWTSGLGGARMVEALGREGAELFTGSVLLEGEYGVDGVAIGVPLRLARDGAGEILEWELSDEERAALHRSAATVGRGLDAVSAGGAAAGV